MNQPGFYLMDCLLAVLIFTMGVTAGLKLTQRTKQVVVMERERTTAWQILTSMAQLPPEVLGTLPARHFDAFGLPAKSGGKYLLTIDRDHEQAVDLFYLEVSYADREGQRQQLSTVRKVWRPET